MAAKLADYLSDYHCAGFGAHDLLEIIDNILPLICGQPRSKLILDYS
jgi:hypothetical protein